jgi:DNA-binding NtrC family response regulator
MERELILRALEETGQDKRRAAALLGISLKTLYNKLNAMQESAPMAG